MTLYQFNQLDELDQTIMLWEYGVQIGERSDPEHNIMLYQIEGFYVEVFYSNADSSLQRIRSFRSVGQLRPYLDAIDINNLM